MEVIDLLRIHKVVLTLVHLLRKTRLVCANVPVGHLVGLAAVNLRQPDKRADERAVAARVLGVVARTPDYTAVLLALGIKSGIPSINHIFGKVLGLFEIALHACKPVGLN